jgi:4-amino-4-deoxy-L-arabinose transferase-like glycosyltransferase
LKIDEVSHVGDGVLTARCEEARFARPVFAGTAAVARGVIAVAMVGGILLRWYRLGGQSLWLDEGYTALQSSLSIPNLIGFARSETYPPLFPLLQHVWTVLFGNSEAALRGVSSFCGILSLAVFYALAKKVLKDGLAVALAVWLFSLSIVQIWYSREARTYELSSFLALVGLYVLVAFLERRSAALFALIVVATAASLYTHNMMFFYLLALDLTWLTYPSQRSVTERIKELLLANVLAGLLYLPWVPSLLSQAARVHGGFWILKPTAATLFGALSFIGGFYPDYLLAVGTRLLPSFAAGIWLCILGGIGILCAAMIVGGFWRVPKAEAKKQISLLLYGLLPVLLVFLLSRVTRPLFIDRVFIASSIVVPLVLAYPLAARSEPKGRMLYGFLGIVLALVTTLSAFGYLRTQEKEDWRGASRSLLGISRGNRLIVFAPTAGEILFNYYAQRFQAARPDIVAIGLPRSFLEQFPPHLGAITGPTDIAPLELAVRSGNYSEVDLVLASESSDDLNQLAFDYLNRSLIFQEERHFYGIKINRFLTRSR